MLRKLPAIPLLIFLCFFAKAQDSIPVFYPPNERFGVKEGLSQGLVMAMMQDKEGYMWFGTSDGLNKYDGYNITVYRNNPTDKYSLPENSISCLLEDTFGNFWAATGNKGLYLFDKKTERFYDVRIPGIFFNGVRDLKLYGDKLLMTTSNDILIFKVKPIDLLKDREHIGQNIQLLFSYNMVQKKVSYKLNPSLGSFRTWMPDCSFWVVFSDTALHYIPTPDFKNWEGKGYSLHSLGIPKDGTSYTTMAPVNNSPGHLLIYSNNNLAGFDELENKIIFRETFWGSFKSLQRQIRPFDDSIFILDNDEDLLFYNQHSKQLTKWDMRQEIRNASFNYGTPFTDASGITWLGSNGFGALKCDLRKQHFANYKTQDGIDAFFTKLNDGFNPLPGIIKAAYVFRYSMVTQDRQGTYWINAFVKGKPEDKLLSYNPETKTLHTWPGPDKFAFRTSVYNDPQDRLWIYASYPPNKNMIYRMDKQTGKPVATYQIPDNNLINPDEFIEQWWQDVNQVFWLATIKGLYRFDPAAGGTKNEWKNWSHINGDSTTISNNWLYSICPDPAEPERYLWLGTNGSGFDKFDRQTGKCVKHYSVKDGLPNNVVYGILPDEAGNLWMSTNKGLGCFNPRVQMFQNFSAEDGLVGDEFNHFQFRKLSNGNLLFGGVDGFTVFNPALVLVKEKPVPIVFTGLSISNKPVDWKNDSTILSAPICYAQTITLHPGQNMFTISFASLEYRSNKKKFYKYRLDGFDKDWAEAGNKNEATYTNLSPGTYTFRVTGTNSDGVWNKKGISIDVTVLPDWYQTWWFSALIVILSASLLYSFYRFRIRQVRRMEQLRNRIAIDLHDEIGSTLSSISLYGEAAKKVMNGNEKANDILSKINQSTSEMLEAISDIVWAINTRNDKLENLANRMRSFAVQLSESKNIEIHFTDNKNLPVMPLDMVQRKNIYLIFKEAVNNAAKYSGCTNLWIDFKNDGHELKMIIKDDGKGFVTPSLEGSPQNSSLGGNGLVNMKQRTSEINGDLAISSITGQGTSIILSVRLKKS